MGLLSYVRYGPRGLQLCGLSLPTFKVRRELVFHAAPVAALLASLVAFSQCEERRMRASQSCSRCEQFEESSSLLLWLAKHGGHYMEGLSLEKIHGRGCGIVNQAGRFFAEGETLLRIPWKLVLQRELVESDRRLKMVLDKWASADQDIYSSQAIRLWLLHHLKYAKSDWSPWLSKLPKDVAAGAESLPLALCFQRSHDLRGTALQRAAQLQLQNLENEWKRLKQVTEYEQLDAELIDTNWQSFVWSEAILSTRSSTLPFAGEEVLISYGEQISPMQFVYAFGFMPKDLEITDLLVPMRAEKPLHLRINREDLENLISAMGDRPRAAQLEALHRFLRLWQQELETESISPSAAELKQRMARFLDEAMSELETIAHSATHKK
ncbi:SET domain-containing protein 8 [Durusdinium trenchii]|uniref:SET domain-containing protein 8 n=1 Tax=Durusdinium trenchii TaxID=1381693 RepID=A0ABP0R9T9_9DINO